MNRVKIHQLVNDQFPEFVQQSYPEFITFIEGYYKGLETPGAVLDVVNNIDHYTKLENISELVFDAELQEDIQYTNDIIKIDSTYGFPESNGLLRIGDEIIFYKSIEGNTFTGCVRGFSGITSYFDNDSKPVEFETSNKDLHNQGDIVYNLHAIFLLEIFKKYKRQYAPGFDNLNFYEGIFEPTVVSRLKDFYASKGSDRSFNVLFKALYGTKVSVVKPRDFLLQPSDADYRVTRDLVVQRLVGDPSELVNRTLFQDETDLIAKAAGTITDVERIFKDGEEYFKLSLDYNPELETFVFSIHPKTKVTNPVLLNQDYLDVDSTLGFPKSGTLIYITDDNITYEIDYTSKSSTQFFGLSSPVSIGLNESITTKDYAYTNLDNGDQVRVKITGVLGDLQYDRDKTFYYEPGDQVQIVSLGQNSSDYLQTSWIINSTPEYEIESVVQVALKLNGAAQYRIKTFDENEFTLGDIGTVKGSDGNQYDIFIIGVSNKNEFDINLTTQIDTVNVKYSIRRGVAKAKSINNTQINSISANVHNVYSTDQNASINDGQDEVYVVSPSLADYYNTPADVEDLSVIFGGQYDGFDINIGNNAFISGDAVYYSYNNNVGLDIQEGQYFIYKVNASTVRLATSRSNIRSGVFVRVFGTVTGNKFELLKNTGQILGQQNLVRRFGPPKQSKSLDERATKPGSTGMFVNGIEISNYKTSDTIYYGEIQSIDVSSPGDSNYDVINPPVLKITDAEPTPGVGFGTGAEAFCNITGSLSRVNILNKGFDYTEVPKVTISGGNGTGAIAKCNISKITHFNNFNAGSLYNDVNINDNTIGFTTDHRFREFEKVIYDTQDQTSLGGLVDKSIYFVKKVDDRKVRLHNTYEDVISGINTVNLSAYGDGLQRIQSFDKKNVISSIEVEDGGYGYENKTLFFDRDDVNINDNSLNIRNHGYIDKQIVKFDTDGNLPTGIGSTIHYYISVIDKDSFRVSEVMNVGTGDTLPKDFNYINRRYVDFVDGGTEIHNIQFLPIELKVEAPIGITTTSGQDFAVKVQPVFQGEITSVSVKKGGINYGSPDILNYNRQPQFELVNGSGGQLTPIVSSFGELIGIVINNTGENYNSPPIIEIIGEGGGAIVTPILQEGKIVDTIIIDGGSGYKQVTTAINVIPTGSGATFQANIKKYTINQIERLFQAEKINNDDGIVATSLILNNGLQYTHGYPGRELRRKVLATSIDADGKTIYKDDIDNDTATNPFHSPIIGWAYDGHPIYGPYGYADKEGGAVRRIRSGYSIQIPSDRPSTSVFPSGLFVEDYVFVGNGDLDRHNGRFCKTPEFPKGVYAYFCTFNDVQEASGPFNGYLKPAFPYVIGNEYKSKPDEYNFDQLSSLDDVDLEDKDLNLVRYTSNLGLLNPKTSYKGFIQPDRFSEGFTEVETITTGSVDILNIVNKGDNYGVNEDIFFDNTNTGGAGAYARISKIDGKVVNQITYNADVIEDVQFVPSQVSGRFIGFGSTSHGFQTGDLVSIQNVNILSTQFGQVYTAGVSTNTLNFAESLGDVSTTGIVTYARVSGEVTFPTLSVNDLYLSNNELIRILEVNVRDKRIKIERSINGISTTFATGSALVENPRKLIINTGFSTDTEYEVDREVYFNPAESATIASENFVVYSEPSPPSTGQGWDYYTVGLGTGSVSYYYDKSPENSKESALVSLGSTTGATTGFGIKSGGFGLSADVHTVSVFLKGSTDGEQVYIILDDTLTYHSNLVTLSSSWRRYSFTTTTSAGTHTIKIGTYGTEGLLLNSSPRFEVWGAQVELGSIRSSYYSTNGSALSRASRQSGIELLNNRTDNQRSLFRNKIDTLTIENHGFTTGDLLTYRVGLGSTAVGLKVGTGLTDFPLQDGTKLYAAVFDTNTIGITTVKVGVGSTGGFVGLGTLPPSLYNLVDYGDSELNSFQTNKDLFISADVYKKTATVQTSVAHDLLDGDLIDFNVTSGINTTIKIAYDDLNRRMIVDPKTFIDSDVSVQENWIQINYHGFRNGDKVILNGSSLPPELTNGAIYYLIVLDDHRFQLSEYFYETITSDKDVQVIDISAQFAATISRINPELNAYRNSTVIFDLSDQTLVANSLPAFNFYLYDNVELTNEFFVGPDPEFIEFSFESGRTQQFTGFNVKISGVVGDSAAKLELIIDDRVPDTLYYNLVPINYNGAAQTKLDIISDEFNIKNNNKLIIRDSQFNVNDAVISGVGSTTFDYTLRVTPERNFYPKNEALLSYTTTSPTAKGPVAEVTIDSIGRGYRSLPAVADIKSSTGIGTNAIFLPASRSIGKIDSLVLTDIGYDYPSDPTLRPKAELPYTYKIEPLSKFKSIKILSPGTNYFVPPQLLVLDGFTGRVNGEVALEYDIGDTEVTIVRNTTGLYNITPRIIPTNNPNGIRIDNITYNNLSKKVTVGFAVTFGSESEFPFKIGDKVLVENTNTTSTSTGKGFNSSAYGYQLFTVENVDVNVGGEFPTITYDMGDYLPVGQGPGEYDAFDSFGTVTPEPYFPIFDIVLEKDTFRAGELVNSLSGNTGVVQTYNLKNEYLKVRSKIPFQRNDLIIGTSSQNKGVISSVEGSDAGYKISSNSITRKGFRKQTGKLNNALQRVHDNEYYQYFSYAVRSPISFEVWNPVVSNLNHTAGFKKFSELTIDSYDPSIAGISTDQNLNTVISISDLVNIVDLNTVRDFDIGREKTIDVGGTLVSNEILFNLPFLAQYQEFVGNRVLTIDDFSDQFNGVNRGFSIFTDGDPVFQIEFNGSSNAIISPGEGSINLTNHFFVSGEVVEYIPPDNNPANAINITPTDFGPGIGTTSKLPSRITIIKQDNQKVRVATSATNALLFNPIGVGLTGVGIGSTHIFRSLEPNNRLLVTINGSIQSPMVGTAYTTALSSNVGIGTTVINVVGVTSIFGGDLLRANDEVMLVAGVNGPANELTVRRGWMGTTPAAHSANQVLTKQIGNYNVVENDLHFSEGPWGNLPVGFGTTATSANEIDYTGLTTSSRFSGRIFLRSALNQGFTTVFTDAYDNNYVYDDISDQFNGINTSFYLKYKGADIDNVTAANTILLIDDIFQGPQRLGNVLTNIEGDYKLEAGGGQLLLGFNGEVTDPTVTKDINVNRVPKGGVIVDVGSLNGYGFQPLVGAGATALVSAAGTISQISIGNSGSGYRSGLQTVVVGIQTRNLDGTNITPIGIATVSDGHVVGVAITNSKIFYAPREISNIGYSSITGITTVTTTTAHNLTLGDEIQVVGAAFTCDYYPPVDVTNALYDTTTGIMTVTTGVSTVNVNGFIYDNVSGIATITTVEPMKIVPMTAIGRSFSLAGLALTCVGYGQTFAVSNFLYDNTSGIATVTTTADHGLSASDDFKMRELIFSCNVGGPTGYGQTFTITQFKYDNVTGLSTITTSDPITGIIGIGSDIRLDNLEFSCPGGSGITTTIFPDGTQGNTFTVTNVIASDQFELNVGVSTIPHTYVENDAGQVTAGLTTTKFPDGSQGYFFRVQTVGTTTSFTVNVGPSTISHAYVSGGIIQVGITTNIFPGNQQNSPLGDTFKVLSAPNWNTLTFNAGISTIPHTYVSGGSLTFGHKLKVGTDVALTGLAFTCSYDGGVGILTHPRVSDPTYCGTQVTRINSINEFEINVGVSTAESFYTSGGIVEEIILAPRHKNNSPTGSDPAASGTTVIKVVDEFSFIIDSGESPYTHFYKRCGEVRQNLDVVIDSPLNYFNVPLIYTDGSVGVGTEATVDLVPSLDSTIDSFEINNFGYGYQPGERLTVAIGGTIGIPTFTTKTSNAILPVVAGGDYPHTYVGGTVSNAVQSGGGYVHTFVSAVTNGVTSNIGNLPNLVTDAAYNPTTGDMVITSASHGLSTSNTISIADNALTFTCTMDGNTANKTYPRSTDPISGIATAITGTTTDTITINVGASPIVNHDVTDATYIPSTGVLQLTIGSHSLTTGTSVKIANGSLTFTCDMDGNATLHSYPRPSDPFYDTAINIDAVTSTTITLNVGISSEVKYPVHDATYDPATGLSVLTIGTHNLTTGTKIKLQPESLLFRCSLDDYNRIEAYPRQYKDRVYGKSIGITSHTSDSITVFAGPSVESQRYQHQFVGVGSYSQFALDINRTFQSKFSGWNVGEFIVLDKIDPFFNGQRRLFPLSVNNESISFFARANSGIDLQSNLLVFINDILQTPGEGYQFTGGSTIRFTEAPKGGVTGFSTTGDTAKIFMYTGTQTIDVRTVDVLPSVEVGDEVQLYSNQNTSFTEDPRLVMDIKAADKVITNNYAGQGVTLDELFERPLTWTKQIVDKFIDNEFVGKDRVYYEPVINPMTNIISSIGAGTSIVYVNSIRPLFDNPYEGIGTKEKSIIEIVPQHVVRPATATAVLGVGGSVTNVLVNNIGYGYTAAPDISIAPPYEGTRATAGAQIGIAGTLTQINVNIGGTGYIKGPLKSMTVSQQGSGFPKIDATTNTFVRARLKSETGIGRGATADIVIDTFNFDVASVVIQDQGANYQVGDTLFIDTYDNVGLGTSSRGFALGAPVKFQVASIEPPEVLVAPPLRSSEECSFVTYQGDYGIIVGVGTTTIGAGTSLGVALDLFMPMDNELRKSLDLTLTGISTGDLFTILGTNFVSAAQTSLSSDGSVIGVSTVHADMIVECIDFYTKQSVIPAGINGLGTTVGIGTTVTTVVVAFESAGSNNVVGLATTAFYGEYSFGKLGLPVRVKQKTFLAEHGTSLAGVSTNPIIRRKNPLKYLGYIS